MRAGQRLDAVSSEAAQTLERRSGELVALALGFALNGLVEESLAGVTCKGGMQPGDVLLLTKAIGKKLGKDKGNSKYLYELFPYGPAKQACKYAGLPKPNRCV